MGEQPDSALLANLFAHMLDTINERRAKGLDTSRLEAVAFDLQERIVELTKEAGKS